MKSSTLPARKREKKNKQTNPSRKRSQGKGEKKKRHKVDRKRHPSSRLHKDDGWVYGMKERRWEPNRSIRRKEDRKIGQDVEKGEGK